MAMERQTSWGWLVALYMFLGGTGAGIYTASFILRFSGELDRLAVAGMIVGPLSVVLGMICLLAETGSPLQSYRFFRGLPTSWMSRGGLIQILFIIFGLGYSVPGFWVSGWLGSIAGMTLGSLAVVLALALAAYHGIALTESKRIPLWSTPLMPVSSFFTALCTGLGLLLLISMAFNGSQVEDGATILGITGIVFIVGNLVTIWLLMSAKTNATYTESVRRIKMPTMASTICLVLTLLLLGLVIGAPNYFTFVFPISGVLLLASGFITRYSILKGGYYIPLRVPVAIPDSK